jgi:hypothetical protein
VFYSHFAALRLEIRSEDTTNQGRGAAAGQGGRVCREVTGSGDPVLLLGIEVSRSEENLVGFEVELA